MTTYNIAPVPKPRMTQRDKWKPSDRAKRYFAFKDECRLKKVKLPESNAHVTFIIKMPKSWSNKKKIEYDTKPHQQTPDVDNLIKALMDAVYGQDCGVYDIRISKYWGYEGIIIIV